MSMINWFVMTPAQVAVAVGMDDDANAVIEPRAVDNASPGVGVNLNDNATGFTSAAPVPLTGMFVSPKRMIDDPAYQQYCPSLLVYLLALPWCSLENETIFAPYDPNA